MEPEYEKIATYDKARQLITEALQLGLELAEDERHAEAQTKMEAALRAWELYW